MGQAQALPKDPIRHPKHLSKPPCSEHALMKAIVFEQFGEPAEVLRLRDVPMPEPGPGQVRVRMIASPVNPSDLLVVRGRYGVLPELPATPGFEGVGVVDEAGPGLARPPGPGETGHGHQRRRGELGRVRGDPGTAGAAGGRRHPRRAGGLVLRQPGDGPGDGPARPAGAAGEWLLQSAAGSALGRMIIKLGRHDGFKTLNVVRRREAIDELKRLGGDAVIASSDGPIDEQVRGITGPEGVKYAIDPVGGDTGTGVFRLAGGRRADARLWHPLGGAPPDRSPADDRRQAGRRGVLARTLDAGAKHPAALLLFHEIATLIRAGVLDHRDRPTFPFDDDRRGRPCGGSRRPARQGAAQDRGSGLSRRPGHRFRIVSGVHRRRFAGQDSEVVSHCGQSRLSGFFSGNSFALPGPSRYNKNVEVEVRQCAFCHPLVPDRLAAID